MSKNMNQKYVTRYLLIIACALFMVMLCFATANAESGLTLQAKVNASGGATVRQSTSTSSAKVGMLNDNTDITIDQEVFTSKTSSSKKKRWYHITANGMSGYIRADLVDSYQYGSSNATVTGKLNYRYGAGTKFKKKGTLKKNAAVTAVLPVKSKQTSYGWYKIRKGSSCYYVSSNYVTVAQTETPAAAPAPAPVSTTTSAPVTPAPVADNPAANGNLTDEIVATRINQLYEQFNGKYFTTDGNAASSSTDPKCNVANVLAQNADVRAFNLKYKGGEAPATTSYMPGHYNLSSSYMLLGCSCCGFANYASWFIGADGVNEDVSCKLVVNNIDYTYSNMCNYAKIGDVLRVSGSYSSGHSMILVEIKQNGCVVLDSNTSGDGQDGWSQSGKNRVYKHTVSWGSNKVTISRNKKR